MGEGDRIRIKVMGALFGGRHPHYHLGRGYFIPFVHDVPKIGTATNKAHLISAVCSAQAFRRNVETRDDRS